MDHMECVERECLLIHGFLNTIVNPEDDWFVSQPYYGLLSMSAHLLWYTTHPYHLRT